MRLISVVMAMASEEARAKASQELLTYGFRFFETRRLYKAGEPVAEARVWKGTVEKVALGVPTDLWVTIPRDEMEKIQAQTEAPRDLEAPLATGNQVGKIRVTLAGQPLAEAPLVPLAAIAEGSLWRRAADTVLLWFE
jgi:D-alanyl-D-alanine carboxypeptidase (penicillin-binding protein 5/6)